jgi:ADP-ribose pyrophosphatase YjhB (NUDIX family)
MNQWQTRSSRIAYENPFMRVHEDQAVNPAGQDCIYGYAESTEDSAYIVPIDTDGGTYLIRQYRYPHQNNYWEVPAGRIPYDENIVDGATRELLEETGLQAHSMTQVGELLSTPGITNFSSKIFLATELSKVSDELDVADGISATKRVSTDEFHDMVANGEVQCATSIAAYYLAQRAFAQMIHAPRRSEQ